MTVGKRDQHIWEGGVWVVETAEMHKVGMPVRPS